MKPSRRTSRLSSSLSPNERFTEDAITLTDEQLQAVGSVIKEWAKAGQTLFVLIFNVFGGPSGPEPAWPQAVAALLATGMDYRTTLRLSRGPIRNQFPEVFHLSYLDTSAMNAPVAGVAYDRPPSAHRVSDDPCH
jgi:hypothetical protein